jgi:hypothetical protein
MAINVDKYSQLPTYDTFNLFGNKKIPFIILLIFVILIYIVLFSFLNNNPNNSPSSMWIIILEVILVVTLIIVIVLNYDTMHDINFSTEIKNLFSGGNPEVDVVAHDVSDNEKQPKHEPEPEEQKDCPTTTDISGEVFHIPNNTYTYDEAKEMCETLDTRLATYDEVESAYNNGGNWCSYGWSDEQMALFPTQKSVYNQLKKIKGHANDCGRPGINGGYIGNKNAKFGVNCYGKKPYITDKNKYFMDNYSFSPAILDSSYNKITKDKTIQNLLISSFNKSKWSFQ